MGKVYDDQSFGVTERIWFGATIKHGGSAAAVIACTGDATAVTRFYPKGPCKIVKFGVQEAGTLGGTACVFTLLRESSTMATTHQAAAAAPYTIASATPSPSACAAGSYLVITVNGTIATGSVIFFIDIAPVFDNSTRWDV